jgi:hypothetical protein
MGDCSINRLIVISFNVDSQRDRDGRLFGQSLQQGEIDFQRQGIRDDRLQGSLRTTLA